MPKKYFNLVVMLLVIVFVSGCGYKARRYVQIKDRVDLEPAGNAGYFTGTPAEGETTPSQETRKVYVLEFTKDLKEEEDEEYKEIISRTPSTQQNTYKKVKRDLPPRPVIPAIDDVPDRSYSPSFEEYVVQKGDTLQKISKHFYDGYSKWPRIYEVNKDVIKNPDSLTVGTILRIPVE